MASTHRSIIVIVTTADDGNVVVQPAGGGSPRVLSGDRAAALLEMASDVTLPEYKPEPGITGRSLVEGIASVISKYGNS